ncbi:MAG: hypothetical protein FADNKDHG_01356 [Holosporales bacterium]
MKFFCFFILIKILSAAQNIDPSPLLIPNDFKILIDAFRIVTEADDFWQSKKTLRQVKEIIDPLKGPFDELVTIERMGELVKELEDKVRYYLDYFEQQYLELYHDCNGETLHKKKEEAREDVVASYKCLQAKDSVGFFTSLKAAVEKIGGHETEPLKDLAYVSHSINNLVYFYDYFNPSDTDLFYFLSQCKSISYVLNFPKEKLDSYCPLDLQKIFFSFYIVAALRVVFKTCDLVVYEEKENIISLDGTPLSIIDVTDKLDEPFFDAFDIMLKENALKLSLCSRKRLLENIFFMLNHHVKFVE